MSAPIRRAPGVLLALALGLALAAWLFEWADSECYPVADRVVCEVR